jgi:hypothetical protein
MLLLLLLAVWPATTARDYAPDLLDPIFLLAAGRLDPSTGSSSGGTSGRYSRRPSHPMVLTTGSVRISAVENPKVNGVGTPFEVRHIADDVLEVLPTPLHPAVATCQL